MIEEVEVDTMSTAEVEVEEGGGGTSMIGVEVVEEGGGIIRAHGRGQGRGRGAATGVAPHHRRRGVWIGHHHQQGGRVRRVRRVRVVVLLMAPPRKPHHSPQLCVRLLRAFCRVLLPASSVRARLLTDPHYMRATQNALHTMMNTLPVFGGRICAAPFTHTHSALTVRARVLLWCCPLRAFSVCWRCARPAESGDGDGMGDR